MHEFFMKRLNGIRSWDCLHSKSYSCVIFQVTKINFEAVDRPFSMAQELWSTKKLNKNNWSFLGVEKRNNSTDTCHWENNLRHNGGRKHCLYYCNNRTPSIKAHQTPTYFFRQNAPLPLFKTHCTFSFPFFNPMLTLHKLQNLSKNWALVVSWLIQKERGCTVFCIRCHKLHCMYVYKDFKQCKSDWASNQE